MRSGSSVQSSSAPAKRARRKMSAATRKAMAEGQRKRWAAAKGEFRAPRPPRSETKAQCRGQGRYRRRLKEAVGWKKAAAKK